MTKMTMIKIIRTKLIKMMYIKWKSITKITMIKIYDGSKWKEEERPMQIKEEVGDVMEIKKKLRQSEREEEKTEDDERKTVEEKHQERTKEAESQVDRRERDKESEEEEAEGG